MSTYRDFKKRVLADKEVRRHYELMRPEYEAWSKIIELRIKYKMSQRKLAEKMGTKQPAISRFENNLENPTVGFLSRAAAVFGKKLVIEFR